MTAVAHIAAEHVVELDAALASVRRSRALSVDFVFHYGKCRPQIRKAFFAALDDLPLRAHARILDKWLWPSPYIRSTRGDERLRSEIVELLMSCPEDLIGNHVLLIDGSLSETKQVALIRTALNRRLTRSGRTGMKRIRICPDSHPTQGAIIQVADMIAGAMRNSGQSESPLPSRLLSRVHLV